MYKKILYFTTISLLLLFICFHTLVSTLNENPYAVKGMVNSSLSMLFPQGWAFFTKDPTDYQLNIYEITENSLKFINSKNVQFSQGFGLNKSNRLLPHLVSERIKVLPANYWFETSEDLKSISLDSLNVIHLPVSDKFDFLKTPTRYLCELKKPIPWLFFSENLKYSKPAYYLIVASKKQEND